MSTGLKIWRKLLSPFDYLEEKKHERLLRLSHQNPIVKVHRRDDFRYYENSRWTTVSGELMSGKTGVDRVIYRQCPLKWNDTGAALTSEERERVLQKVGEHLDRSGIRWNFDDRLDELK